MGVMYQLFGIRPKRKGTRKRKKSSNRNVNIGLFGKTIGGKQYAYKSSSTTKSGANARARSLREAGAKVKITGKRGKWLIFTG